MKASGAAVTIHRAAVGPTEPAAIYIMLAETLNEYMDSASYRQFYFRAVKAVAKELLPFALKAQVGVGEIWAHFRQCGLLNLKSRQK